MAFVVTEAATVSFSVLRKGPEGAVTPVLITHENMVKLEELLDAWAEQLEIPGLIVEVKRV